jgi:hypothetical protein
LLGWSWLFCTVSWDIYRSWASYCYDLISQRYCRRWKHFRLWPGIH